MLGTTGTSWQGHQHSFSEGCTPQPQKFGDLSPSSLQLRTPPVQPQDWEDFGAPQLMGPGGTQQLLHSYRENN